MISKIEVLFSRLRAWQRLAARQKLIYFSGRGFVLSLAAAALIELFLIPSNNIPVQNYFTVLLVSGAAGLLIGAAAARLAREPLFKTAQQYDHIFNLHARVATAVELSQDPLSDAAWKDLQLEDALHATADVNPTDGIHWHFPKFESRILLLALILVLGSWIYGQSSFQLAGNRARTQAVIGNEIEKLERLVSELEDDGQISSEDKQAILFPLQESLEKLDQAETLEEAVSALGEAQKAIEKLGAQQTQAFEGLQQAGENLSKEAGSPLTEFGQALAEGDLQAAAESLQNFDLASMNGDQISDLADQLEQAGQDLAASYPQLSQALGGAANALRTADLQGAQASLAQAGNALMEAQQQAAFNQTINKVGGALDESGGKLRGEASAGSGEFQQAGEPGDEAGDKPIGQDGPSDGEGEGEFDSGYEATRIGGDGDTDLALESPAGAEGTVIGNITAELNQYAQSGIIDSQTLAAIRETIQTAIENGTIPLSFQSLIRDYFSSLDPQ